MEGANPTHYDPKNPITLFIIQVSFHEYPYNLPWPVGRDRGFTPAMPCHAVPWSTAAVAVCAWP